MDEGSAIAKIGAMTANLYSLVCLDHGDTTLYTELVQVVAQQQRYWVRPILLRESTKTGMNYECDSENLTVHDMRSCSDLLWPSNCFRQVYDTEFIPLLSYLQPDMFLMMESQTQNSPSIQQARQKLHRFIHGFWDANASPSSGIG
jgi:hypothetical protein